MSLVVTSLLAAAAAAGGCGTGPDRLWVTGLEVTNEIDFGALDVEIHMFDVDTGEFLGCSGASEGLRDVDASDVRYDLDGWFRTPAGDRIDPDALFGIDVELQVIEDDADPCPAPPGPSDDVIGISGPLPGEGLGDITPVSFDNVVYLELGVY
ncbi:MAG: hypothetical protein H6708_15885 [Kofleriaceae bacterium]|nr:hypothetical protein [Myxococcales bacterium]MCB9561885.1 hypothetical protein [Kofleriaceae bacterium]